MSILIPFNQCIARPSDEQFEYFLSDHLLHVKRNIEIRLVGLDSTIVNLAGVAGICHDLLKSNLEWQLYIQGKKKKGPPHAPGGALLFSYFAYHLLQFYEKWDDYSLYWLWFIRDLADHHGNLKSLADTNWMMYPEWNKLDWVGMGQFIKSCFSTIKDLEISPQALKQWIGDLREIYEDEKEKLDLSYQQISSNILMDKLQLWRECSTALIASDRLDVVSVSDSHFKKEDHITNEQNLQSFCENNKQHPLSYIRMKAQQDIVNQINFYPDNMVYTLEMPTGYGKTITALKLASILGREQGYERIVYVAPYLSILEQTAQVIEDAMHVLAVEQHSLATLEGRASDKSESEEYLLETQMAIETWAYPVICTSFQQWTKVIFPERAQDLLRRSFLKNGIIIIDEPQIYAPESWNVFLCGLEALARRNNLRVFFLSATMPPFKYGLSKSNEPIHLSIKEDTPTNRYQITRCPSMDETSLAELILKYKNFQQCAILNTIADAYLVYKNVNTFDKNANTHLLHGMMTPIHKKMEINKIQHYLNQAEHHPICVISTQIMEAGVDLSFQYLMRALPILPSVIQAAGRVNRHNENDIGTFFLIPFFRNGEKNTRNSIYDKKLQYITDQLLEKKTMWLESEMMSLIKIYYQEMFRNNTYEAGKQAITNAYEGDWPELANIQPFGQDYFRLPIFIPWTPNEAEKQWLPKTFVRLQKKIGINTPEELYERYSDRKYMNNLSFQARKEFMILFHYYVINVPGALAIKLVNKEDYLIHKVPCILGNDVYHPVMGLAQRYVDGFDNII
ncbi:MAG: CRISPR-associated helicase Cas3' [Veillonellales bacterium]